MERALPLLRPPARAMARLQRPTGVRPGGACRLTLGQADRSAGPWVDRPAQHGARHRGKGRAVPI